MPWLFLAVSVWGALWTLTACFPRKGKVLLAPTFFMSWLTIELAPWHLFWQIAATVVLGYFGAFEAWPGWLGLAICAVSWTMLAVMWSQSVRSSATMRNTLADLDPEDHDRSFPRVPRYQRIFPFALFRRDVVVERNIPYQRVAGKEIRLDVYRPKNPPTDGRLLPSVLQIHGGGWVIGDKREQGIPLLLHLAANGWVGFNVNYRLSPGATFPDPLVDLKRSIAWIREHAHEYGADPNHLVVTGGSAGGHLTALVALTANDPRYQPGFESVDTSVKAAVPFYGVYDFTNRLGTWDPDAFKLLLEPLVMKAFLAEEPEKFAAASPIDQVRQDAPPFLVIHGDKDTLAPVQDTRYFVERLRAVSDEPVLYAELHGSQHAFDVFGSVRTHHVVEAVERFLRIDLEQDIPEAAEAEVTADPESVPAN